MPYPWLNASDPEPDETSVVENGEGKIWVHSLSGWIGSDGNVYDWSEVAGDNGPVRIITRARP